MGDIESGSHLGVVRSWMQRKARNGSTVTWGSNTELVMSVTVWDMERLAQDIREAVVKDVLAEQKRKEQHDKLLKSAGISVKD